MPSSAAPDDATLDALLAVWKAAEPLKSTLRTGHAASGRPESTAEHTWRLMFAVLLFADDLPGVDVRRLLKICLVHDLAEAVSGDVPAIDQTAGDGKSARERADLAGLLAPLPAPRRDAILALWEEYEAAASAEAVLAKGFDKLETILQHTQGANPPDFDHAFNLTYGAKHTARHPLLARLRERIDAETRTRMAERGDEAR
jgi:putative hydrolase of HD superfamily